MRTMRTAETLKLFSVEAVVFYPIFPFPCPRPPSDDALPMLSRCFVSRRYPIITISRVMRDPPIRPNRAEVFFKHSLSANLPLTVFPPNACIVPFRNRENDRLWKTN